MKTTTLKVMRTANDSLILAVVMLLIGLFFGSVVGVMATRDTWEKSAIEAGAGRYTCDKEGKTTWVWTTKDETLNKKSE